MHRIKMRLFITGQIRGNEENPNSVAEGGKRELGQWGSGGMKWWKMLFPTGEND